MLRTTVANMGLLVLLGIAGCQSLVVSERLDPASGATLVTQSQPRVFARSLPQYSRSGRDYLYLGPVEINRQGERAYGLWVGLATTIDPRFLAPTDYGEGVLYLQVNGELMALPLRPWTDWAVSLGNEPIYQTALALEQQLVAVVTLDQLAMLAVMNLPDVYLGIAGARSRRYGLWSRDSGDWSEFVGRARGVTSGAGVTARSGSDR